MSLTKNLKPKTKFFFHCTLEDLPNFLRVWTRDRPIWLFWGSFQYISHSWTNNQYFQNF